MEVNEFYFRLNLYSSMHPTTVVYTRIIYFETFFLFPSQFVLIGEETDISDLTPDLEEAGRSPLAVHIYTTVRVIYVQDALFFPLIASRSHRSRHWVNAQEGYTWVLTSFPKLPTNRLPGFSCLHSPVVTPWKASVFGEELGTIYHNVSQAHAVSPSISRNESNGNPFTYAKSKCATSLTRV